MLMLRLLLSFITPYSL